MQFGFNGCKYMAKDRVMTVRKDALVIMKGKKIENIYNLVENLVTGKVVWHSVNSNSGSATTLCAHSDRGCDYNFMKDGCTT